MADLEIPEAGNEFERRVALTIAIMAVILAVITQKGDNAKGEGLLSATRASNQWAYYQAKSIKEHAYVIQSEILEISHAGAVDQAKLDSLLDKYKQSALRYETEKDEIKKKAEEYEANIVKNSEINDRCDLAGLLLEVGIVIGSVAILVEWGLFWYASIVLGMLGSLGGFSAFLM